MLVKYALQARKALTLEDHYARPISCVTNDTVIFSFNVKTPPDIQEALDKGMVEVEEPRLPKFRFKWFGKVYAIYKEPIECQMETYDPFSGSTY